MRRVNIWSMTMLVLTVASGIALLWGRPLALGHFIFPATALAAAGGMSAAVCGIGLMTQLRRQCRHLIQFIEATDLDQRSADAHDAAPTLGPLCRSIDGLLDRVAAMTDRVAARAKEMEIHLKVATAERQHAQAVLYSLSDAVLVTDLFDEVVLANESAARTLEFDLKRSRRSPVDQVLDDEVLVAMIRDMRKSDSRGGKRIVEHKIVSPAGEKTYKVTLSSVPGTEGEPGGVVAVLHDVTREREVAEMKNDFVSSVSHELRTPLASIHAYVEMLIDGEARDEKTAQEFYEIIRTEAQRLGRLIDNILNISRIESGLVKINKQPQSLTVVLKDALEVIAPQARLKGLSIVEKLTPVFYQTLADKDMLYQAVLNLMSNAVKYTPQGGTITVETEVDEAGGRVVGRIRDTGAGIPPKDLPFVFDKFYRVEANNHMAKGTGLGLSLVRHIIETVHQGRIVVDSQVGKGSCFGFELELCK
jgi:two-component system phosphate regulon sensor histidine kinase PhoR